VSAAFICRSFGGLAVSGIGVEHDFHGFAVPALLGAPFIGPVPRRRDEPAPSPAGTTNAGSKEETTV